MADRIGNVGQQIGLKEIRNNLRVKILQLRSIDYVLSKKGMDKIWPSLTRDERVAIDGWIRHVEPEELKKWIHNHPHLELGEKSVERLREIARDLDVKNYSRLSKHRLINLINKSIKVEA